MSRGRGKEEVWRKRKEEEKRLGGCKGTGGWWGVDGKREKKVK